jgi:hypothetical protein
MAEKGGTKIREIEQTRNLGTKEFQELCDKWVRWLMDDDPNSRDG